MKEEFLHYIWQFQLLNKVEFETVHGEKIQILKVGEKNTDAGPDFFNGKIKIGETVWAGNIEIHVNSSDWNNHKHQSDSAYDNVILHVVLSHDIEIKTSKNRNLPTLELANLMDNKLYDKYKSLVSEKRKIPCQNFLPSIDEFTIHNWQDRLVVERLERKSKVIVASLGETNNDWEETFYRLLAKNFGFKLNALPFELTAKSLPFKYLKKHKDNLNQLESLILGQAGFLAGSFTDEYPIGLQKEYQFLKSKFKLEPIEKHLWKFLRLRPSNFPVIRLVQFAKLIHISENLFSSSIESNSLVEVQKLLSIKLHGYWDNHYQLDKQSVKRPKKFGKLSVDLILINTIVPFMFTYGKRKNKPSQVEKAMEFLGKINGEKNSITSSWESCGIKIDSAFKSQAMIQLKNEYCSKVKCLSCAIGNKILRT
ncbi:MAG: DUF2851 family protein [Flavobacteriales bacterium]|nr:DUF2851 family protein [Flavobacteriales bacterium]